MAYLASRVALTLAITVSKVARPNTRRRVQVRPPTALSQLQALLDKVIIAEHLTTIRPRRAREAGQAGGAEDVAAEVLGVVGEEGQVANASLDEEVLLGGLDGLVEGVEVEGRGFVAC